MEKSEADGNVSSHGHVSHEAASSTGENKTNLPNLRDTEDSTVSSERVHSAQQTSIRGNSSSDNVQSFKGKRKDLDFPVMAEIGRENQTTKMSDHNKLLKTDSASSKESGEVVQVSSVDSTDPVLSQSSNEYLVEKISCATHSDESKITSQVHESSVTTKSDSIAASMLLSRHSKFDLNEGTEGNGVECNQVAHESGFSFGASSNVSEPISVVAKFGVPMGLPKKPLQFGGELGWKRSGTSSAFRPAAFKNPERDWIDLNVAATMDSELPTDETSMNTISKQPERIFLDLNCKSENNENQLIPVASSFNLNDNPMNEDTHIYQHTENQQLQRKADTVTCSGGNVYQPVLDTRRPSFWVDLGSMQGFGHVQPRPFLVAAPTAEQVQMMVPSGLYIGKVNNLPPTFYPQSVVPHLSNQHGPAVIPQIPGSVLAAYPGAVHFLQGSQGPNSHAYANVSSTSFSYGSIPHMEINGSRGGVSNAEHMIPVRNGLFEAREKPVEQVALPASQINYRQMASWN